MKSKVINIINSVAFVILLAFTIYLMFVFNTTGDNIVGDTTSIMFGVVFLALDVMITFIFMLLSIWNVKSDNKLHRNYSLIIDILFLINIILCVYKMFSM